LKHLRHLPPAALTAANSMAPQHHCCCHLAAAAAAAAGRLPSSCTACVQQLAHTRRSHCCSAAGV
jgi:hypothetical protein